MSIYWLNFIVFVATLCCLFILQVVNAVIAIQLYNYLKKNHVKIARKLTIDGSISFINTSMSLFRKWNNTNELDKDSFVWRKKKCMKIIRKQSLFLSFVLIILALATFLYALYSSGYEFTSLTGQVK